MICKNCGFQNKEEVKFCEKCGQALLKESSLKDNLEKPMEQEVGEPINLEKPMEQEVEEPINLEKPMEQEAGEPINPEETESMIPSEEETKENDRSSEAVIQPTLQPQTVKSGNKKMVFVICALIILIVFAVIVLVIIGFGMGEKGQGENLPAQGKVESSESVAEVSKPETAKPSLPAPLMSPKWKIEPTYDFYDLRPFDVHRYGIEFSPHAYEDYTNVVMIVTGNQDEKLYTRYFSNRSGVGMVNYNGKVLVEPSENNSFFPVCGMTHQGEDEYSYTATGARGEWHGGHGLFARSYFSIDEGHIVDVSTEYMTSLWGETCGAIPAYLGSADEVGNMPPFEGYALVNAKGGAINKTIYDDGFLSTENSIALCFDGKWGFVDEYGKEIIPFKYDDAMYFANGLAPVKKNDKWGYIRADGSLYIDYVFEDALPPGGNYAWVKQNGKWGVIDVSGK